MSTNVKESGEMFVNAPRYGLFDGPLMEQQNSRFDRLGHAFGDRPAWLYGGAPRGRRRAGRGK